MAPTTLQFNFAYAIFIYNLHFVFPGTDDQTFRYLVQAATEGLESFLERGFWIVVARNGNKVR